MRTWTKGRKIRIVLVITGMLILAWLVCNLEIMSYG